MRRGATQQLANFAVGLRYNQIPAEVIVRAKACLLDTLAVCLYGSTKPWSRSVVHYLRSFGTSGPSTVIGFAANSQPPLAALANGTMAHAFELDNVRQPGAGVHPGATAFLPAFAVAQQQHSNGKEFLTAFVAACEVMSRIGVAAGNSLEKRGFHAPALTGTFGAAVAAGRLLKFNEGKLVNAMGIAGSYSGGLMEFSRCQEGAMIKRLHLGKAAAGGVTAAFLAQQGFTGPESVLEGEFGFCRAFSSAPDFPRLTYRLGREFESMNICIKRYACHINAHAPIEALAQLRDEHHFDAGEVGEIIIGGIEKLVTHHANYRPNDLMAAQYSIPFCVALSLYHNPEEPGSFNDRKVHDRKILTAMRKIHLGIDREIEEQGWDRAARVTVKLKDGRQFTALNIHFRGSPKNFLTPDEVQSKAQRLTRDLISTKKLSRLVDHIDRVEKLDDVSVLGRLLKAEH